VYHSDLIFELTVQRYEHYSELANFSTEIWNFAQLFVPLQTKSDEGFANGYIQEGS
jgi:hypothetical protein